MALIIIITAVIFILSISRISDDADYKKWLLYYFLGLFFWHGMGFISGGLHSEWRELTYRYTNTLFNAGLCLTSFSFVQIAYLFPTRGFENERRKSSYIIGLVCVAYLATIFWYHFLKDQTNATSYTYGKFVNPLAGSFGLIVTIFSLVVFLRKSLFFRRMGSKDKVPARLLALCTAITIALSGLFIYPGISTPFVLPTYIYGLWILIQAQLLIFIIYSHFPVRFELKLVGFTFTSVMAILSILTMLIVPFTTNSDDAVNLAQRSHDQELLLKLMLIIIGSAVFIAWIYPFILRVSLIKPLENLMKGIEKANQGNLEVEVPYGMLDEIGVVTNNFNLMVKSLKQSQNQLTAHANTLEQQVADRTSELRNSLNDLKSTQAQLIQSEKMASLGELTAGIAHEIQNPLNFVNNFSELNSELVKEIKQELIIGNEQLAKGEIEETINHLKNAIEVSRDIEANSEKINHHGKRAESIVKSMLEHSRKSSGIKELTDINKLCDEYVRLSYQGLRAKKKEFICDYKLDLDPNLPLVNVVTQDIGRVILNIINNAFQACNEKSQDLKKRIEQEKSPMDTDPTLRSLPTGQEGLELVSISGGRGKTEKYQPLISLATRNLDNLIEIKITDDGPGIPDSIKDKIFQPFFTTKPTGQGTGLGLSLAYDIIKAHGGEINVKSEAGLGAEFIIQIPTL
jgi:signal transduction histidine kinase